MADAPPKDTKYTSVVVKPFKQLNVEVRGGVAIVSFVNPKLLEEATINEVGAELFRLVDEDGFRRMVVDYTGAEFHASTALGKLITLDKKMTAYGGKLAFANVRPEIYEVFKITKLNKLFKIKDTLDEALAHVAS